MAERIEKRVRGRLFAIYGTIAAGILTAFTYFEYDIVTSIKPSVINASMEKIQPILDNAKSLANAAGILTIRNSAELDAISRFRINAQARITTTMDRLNGATASIESTLNDLRNKLDSAEKNVDAYRERSSDLFLSASYEETIEEIAKSVVSLTTALASLETDTNTVVLSGLNTSASKLTLDTVLERSSASKTGDKTTVYFQFAGVKRELAEKISKAVENDEFTIPGEERLAAAAGESEVRYFFSEDKDKAGDLVKQVNSVLASMNLKANVHTRV